MIKKRIRFEEIKTNKLIKIIFTKTYTKTNSVICLSWLYFWMYTTHQVSRFIAPIICYSNFKWKQTTICLYNGDRSITHLFQFCSQVIWSELL